MINVSIKSVEKKKSLKTNKDYWTVATDKGQMSVWEEDLANKLYLNTGNTVSIEVEEKGQYKNILKAEFPKVVIPTQQPKVDFETMSKRKAISILMSYAKDMYVANLTEQAKYCKTMEQLADAMERMRLQMLTDTKSLLLLTEELANETDEEVI